MHGGLWRLSVGWLEKRGADIHAKDNGGLTPLDHAEKNKQAAAVEWLKWFARKAENRIDPRDFAKIENVELRREFIRFVGIERVVQACGAEVLDKQGDYELLSVNLGGETGAWPYLKMLNPSMGVWHLEAVEKDVSTVEQALAWRNQSDFTPEQLT